MSVTSREAGLYLMAAMLLGGGVLMAQTAPASEPVQTPRVTYGTPIVGPMQHPAVVMYDGGRLEVRARNSSLNQILGDIARRTGMKVTGTVNEEHVFGFYGPGTAATVLVSLLEGTGSNMVLRVSASGVPTELILTPRNGGPTPPEPEVPAVASSAPLANPVSGIGAPAATLSRMPVAGSPTGVSPMYGEGVPPVRDAGASQGANGQQLDSNGQTVWPKHHVVQQQMPTMPTAPQ